MYKLRQGQESFQVVDGPFEGRQYARGRLYREVPAAYRSRFETVQGESPEPKARSARADAGKKAASPKPKVK